MISHPACSTGRVQLPAAIRKDPVPVVKPRASQAANLRIVLLGIGIVVIADRALLTVIGKAPPISIGTWGLLILAALAAVAASVAYERCTPRKRSTSRRAEVELAAIRPYRMRAVSVHSVGRARREIYLN